MNNAVDLTQVPFSTDGVTIQPLSQIISDIKNREEFLQRTIRKLREAEARKPVPESEAIQELKSELDTLRSRFTNGFWMSDEEKAQIEDWKRTHINEYHNGSHGGAIGGMFTYEFIPTSIGTIGTCVCGQCRRQSIVEACGNLDMANKSLEARNGEFTFRHLT